MKVLVLHFLNKENSKHAGILRNLEAAARKKGADVDVVDGAKDISALRLTFYEYISVIIPSSPLFGAKVPARVSEIFASCGTVSGKKGCAFVVKSGFSSNKTCRLLMKAMEKDGILLDYFDIIESADHASASGQNIG